MGSDPSLSAISSVTGNPVDGIIRKCATPTLTHMQRSTLIRPGPSRESFLARTGAMGVTGLLGAWGWRAAAATSIELPFVVAPEIADVVRAARGEIIVKSSNTKIAESQAGNLTVAKCLRRSLQQ